MDAGIAARPRPNRPQRDAVSDEKGIADDRPESINLKSDETTETERWYQQIASGRPFIPLPESRPPSIPCAFESRGSGDPIGWFPEGGRLSVLSAKGGVGKTTALIQLAQAAALGQGTQPFGGPSGGVDFYARGPGGRVLVLLAEEDQHVANVLMYRALMALGIHDDPRQTREERDRRADKRRLISERVIVVPGFMRPAVLCDAGKPVRTFHEIRKGLQSDGDPWRLIVLDPFIDVSGIVEENNNSEAREVMTALQRLTQGVKDAPAVIVAHHTAKADRTGGARGAGAIVNSARFAASMAFADEDEDVRTLRVTKSNYGRRPAPLFLKWNTGDNGDGLGLTGAPPPKETKKAAAKIEGDPTW